MICKFKENSITILAQEIRTLEHCYVIVVNKSVTFETDSCKLLFLDFLIRIELLFRISPLNVDIERFRYYQYFKTNCMYERYTYSN